MQYLFWLTTLFVLTICIPAQAVEVRPLADCTIKVFRDINRSRAWSGKAPVGCPAGIHVEQRASGIFVTTWNSGNSERGWVRLSFSAALGFSEIADGQSLKKAGHDITTRAARIERCLNSIIRVNDPLECRDHATKSYLVGEETGVEYVRQVWLDDSGRHSVVEYAYGDSSAAVSPPLELFSGAALPPGTKLNIHVLDNQ
ncbi:MAG: hypothetical protein H7Y05_14430 [Steroidobacteraceae bacterium]|nr:hypothetical protein [Deltaproteobacteria bacterium]